MIAMVAYAPCSFVDPFATVRLWLSRRIGGGFQNAGLVSRYVVE